MTSQLQPEENNYGAELKNRSDRRNAIFLANFLPIGADYGERSQRRK